MKLTCSNARCDLCGHFGALRLVTLPSRLHPSERIFGNTEGTLGTLPLVHCDWLRYARVALLGHATCYARVVICVHLWDFRGRRGSLATLLWARVTDDLTSLGGERAGTKQPGKMLVLGDSVDLVLRISGGNAPSQNPWWTFLLSWGTWWNTWWNTW